MTSKTATETNNDGKAANNDNEKNATTDPAELKKAEAMAGGDNNTDGGAPAELVDGKKAADGSGSSAPSSPSKKAPKEPKVTVHKTDYEKDVVYVYQFGRGATLPSASPYCFKVENWLRMADIKYENVDHKLKYKSKKGQLPFVELNGREIADSDIIIRELSEHFQKDIDEGLTNEQKTISHAFESMLNNHTSWVVRWWRYNNPDAFLKVAQLDIKRTLNSWIPPFILNGLFKIGFKSNVKQAIGHGLGRHSNEEIYDFGKSDLKTLSQQLGENEYFFGKEPHLLDCNAFAHLCQFIYVPFEGMKEWIETETPNLAAFVDRMKERYWSDWTEVCETLEMNTHLPKKELTEDEKKAVEVKEETKRKKDELKKQKEEQKKELAEKKKKEKEEKEQKKKEAKEKAEKEKAEKAEKEKAEKEAADKEKAEKAEKEKAEAEAKEKAEKEAKAAEEEKAKSADGETKDAPQAAAEPKASDAKTDDSKEAEKKE